MKSSIKSALLFAALSVAMAASTTASAEPLKLTRDYKEATGTVVSVSESDKGEYQVATRETMLAGTTGTLGKNIVYRLRGVDETRSGYRYVSYAVGNNGPDKSDLK